MRNIYGALKISNGVNSEILEKLKLKRKLLREKVKTPVVDRGSLTSPVRLVTMGQVSRIEASAFA